MAEYLKKAIQRPEEDLSAVRDAVQAILEKVKNEGEAGVRYYSEKFDQWSPKSFRVSEAEIEETKRSYPKVNWKTLSSASARFAILPRNR